MGCASVKPASSEPLQKRETHKTVKPCSNYPNLSDHNNFMAKCLTKKIYDTLSKRNTEKGFTIDQAIQTGVDNPGHPFIMTVGCVAGDEESYQVFSELFDPVIAARHNGYGKDDTQPTDLNPDHLTGNAEFDTDYVLSTRVRTGRSIKGYSLPPNCTRKERRYVEKIVVEALAKIDEEFSGQYYPLTNMSEEQQQQLIDDHFLFDKPVSPLLLSSRMARDWPDARGIWHNSNKSFLIWVNEEDHIRIISMQKGGNMKEVFTRFCNGLSLIEDNIKSNNNEFMYTEHLGFILTCPSNLGTGLRAGVHVKLPHLSKCFLFDDILHELRLQKRGTGGVDTASECGVFDISNLDRLGYSEVSLVQKVIDGVNLLIEMEKQLEKNCWIHSLLPDKLRDEDTIKGYPNLSAHNNYMSLCMNPSIYKLIHEKETSSGFTLDAAIQTGVDNPGHPFIMTVGCVAGDEESYQVFAELFDSVIEKRHNGYKKDDIHKTDLDHTKLKGGVLDSNYVLSSRVRTGRSIRGFALPPHCSRKERRCIERSVVDALSRFDGSYRGKYSDLKTMTEEDQNKLIEEHFLFDKPVSPLLLASKMARDWPDARGIWHNDDKNLLVWVNEEDHTRIISMQKGGNMQEVFERFCNGLNKFEEELKKDGNILMWNEHLGYILTCPSNLGTGLRGGVHVRLTNLAKNPLFSSILFDLRLQKRGTGGVDTESTDGVFDISNLDRLGYSEVELVQTVVDGVNALIAMEKFLEAGNELTGTAHPNYPNLSNQTNVLAKVLNKALFWQLYNIETTSGFTLDRVIQPGVDGASCIGCVAGDEKTYEVMRNLFDRVIAIIHPKFTSSPHVTDIQVSNLSDENHELYVISSEINIIRNIKGHPLPPACTRKERRIVEDLVNTVLKAHDSWSYTPLSDLTEDDKCLFTVTPLMTSSGLSRDMPEARGVWKTDDKNLKILVNKEDHLYFTLVQSDYKVVSAFESLFREVSNFESELKKSELEYMRNDRLGFLTTSPSNLGTALAIKVDMKLPKLLTHSSFDSVIAKCSCSVKLEVSETEGVCTISNRVCLGISEVQILHSVIDCITQLIQAEKELASESTP